MKKVIMTIGAPGSGKTTWALEQAADKKHKTIVLNRDDLRAMLFGGKYKYSRANENIVMNAMVNMLNDALVDNSIQRIIIADTNLNESTRNKFNSVIEKHSKLDKPICTEHKHFDVSWVELEKRNLKRGDKAVPKQVLRDMYLKMQKYMGKHKQYTPDPTKQKAVIFDLDGTLANNDHRHAFDYEKLIDDKPIEFVVELARMYAQNDYDIICVSGRNAGDKETNDKHWHATASWLSKNNIPWSVLYMRDWDDNRADDIIKEEIFWNKIENNWNVECAFDDRDRVVEMWRRIGVNCSQVNFGEF